MRTASIIIPTFNRAHIVTRAVESAINQNVGCMKDIAQYLVQRPLAMSPACAIFIKKDALKNLLLEIPNARGIYGKDSGIGEDLLFSGLSIGAFTKGRRRSSGFC